MDQVEVNRVLGFKEQHIIMITIKDHKEKNFNRIPIVCQLRKIILLNRRFFYVFFMFYFEDIVVIEQV